MEKLLSSIVAVSYLPSASLIRRSYTIPIENSLVVGVGKEEGVDFGWLAEEIAGLLGSCCLTNVTAEEFLKAIPDYSGNPCYLPWNS